jgi:anti-anti-sigma factor
VVEGIDMKATTSAFSTPFEIHAEQRAHTVFMLLSGEFVLGCEHRFSEAFKAIDYEGFHRLILDLRGMTFIDSTGLGVIVELWKRSREERFDLELVRGPETIQRAFELAGLEELIHTVDDSSPH